MTASTLTERRDAATQHAHILNANSSSCAQQLSTCCIRSVATNRFCSSPLSSSSRALALPHAPLLRRTPGLRHARARMATRHHAPVARPVDCLLRRLETAIPTRAIAAHAACVASSCAVGRARVLTLLRGVRSAVNALTFVGSAELLARCVALRVFAAALPCGTPALSRAAMWPASRHFRPILRNSRTDACVRGVAAAQRRRKRRSPPLELPRLRRLAAAAAALRGRRAGARSLSQQARLHCSALYCAV